MFRQIAALYSRYAHRHLGLSASGPSLTDNSGAVIGHIDRIAYEKGCFRLVGWAKAETVSLVLAGQQVVAKPSIWRSDVFAAAGISGPQGFDLSLPIGFSELPKCAPPGLKITTASDAPKVGPVSLPSFSQRQIQRAHRRCLLGFLRDGIAALPAIIGWMTERRPNYREQVKRHLGLCHPVPRAGGVPSLGPVGAMHPALAALRRSRKPGVLIVLPVYNALASLKEALRRVEAHTDIPWHLVLIDDASPDPDVQPFLNAWTARNKTRTTLLQNAENIGFVGTVNRGLDHIAKMKAERHWPVVLLNSDAFVPDGWAMRLIAPLLSDPGVASVTPMSNAAEVMTAPILCRNVGLKAGQADRIDLAAQRLNPLDWTATVPTGVGFCMALSREWLRHVPQLDTAFGRGYGEEVDWCQKTRALGARHVGQPALFVEHASGQSFGDTDKSALITAHHSIILNRYPDYDQQVQDFIAADPLSSGRLALAFAWAGAIATEHTPVFIGHSMGGGAEHALQKDIQSALETNPAAIVLRLGGTHRWRLELLTSHGQTTGETNELEDVRSLLSLIPRKRLVYSCAVGDRDVAGLPDVLLSMLNPHDLSELKFHDYLPLSPSYTLLGQDGRYNGPPLADTQDRAHLYTRPDRTITPLSDWQSAWHRLAKRSKLTVFSKSSKAIVSRVWPDLEQTICVEPHVAPTVPRIMQHRNAGVTIAVLGAIGQQKGAEFVRAFSLQMPRNPNVRLAVIGQVDPSFGLPPWVTVHGAYHRRDIAKLAQKYNVTHWLIPSIWPETFCFTVYEALSTGLPSLAFDLGAQGEAVRNAPNGVPLPAELLTHPNAPQQAAKLILETVQMHAFQGAA
ncbi:MAG: glycosyltransferase [Thalassococcus sp.]|uniref:glycosyltransferase n=1 Tax=Thalassococcus sp. TaxID=1928858 RepID=UPI001B0EB61E|nr:glycosyltransferase [Thalassococcus sp.]MBO6868371.1 glycosyltransferase [Thalassococcus sp.]